MSLGRGIGRQETTRFKRDIASACYGCGRPYTIVDQPTRAEEVLCKRCRNGAEPQAVDGYGLLLADKEHS